MQWPPLAREAEEQAAWGIFVVRIFLDNHGVRASLPDLQPADIPLYDSAEGVTGEDELPDCQLCANFLKGFASCP